MRYKRDGEKDVKKNVTKKERDRRPGCWWEVGSVVVELAINQNEFRR